MAANESAPGPADRSGLRLTSGAPRHRDRPATARPPTMAGCHRHPSPGPSCRVRAASSPTVSPAAGMVDRLGSAALFGMLGPLSRFAYDAGMEPPAFVAWRALIGLGATAAFVAWRVRRRDITLARRSGLPGSAAAGSCCSAALMGFTLNLCDVHRLRPDHGGPGPARVLHVPGDGRRREHRAWPRAPGPPPGRRAGAGAAWDGGRRRLAAGPGGRHPLRRPRLRPRARRRAEPDRLRRRQPGRLPDGPDRAGDDRGADGDGRRARALVSLVTGHADVAGVPVQRRRRSCRCCCSPASSPRRSRRSRSSPGSGRSAGRAPAS